MSEYPEEIRDQKIHLAGIYIPVELLCNPEINQTERSLFGYLQNLSKTSQGCWASNEYLGKRLWIGAQSVSNSLANLKKYRYINIIFENKKGNNQKQRRIFINPEYQTLYHEAVMTYHDNLDLDYNTLLEKLYPLIRKLITNYINDNSSSYEESFLISSKLKTIHSCKEEMDSANPSMSSPGKIRLKRRSKLSIIKSKLADKKFLTAVSAEKKSPIIKIPESVQDIFDFWSEKGLRMPKKNPSKTLQQCIQLTNKLLKGRLSREDKHIYTPEEIKMTIDRFATAAFDKEFYPVGSRKDQMKQMYISDFIESTIRLNGDLTKINPFKRYYNESPTRIVNILPDKQPGFTITLKKLYEKDVLGKIRPKYSTREENNFRKSSEKFMEFLKKNQDRIRGSICDEEGATALWKAIIKDAGDSRKVNTGWLCSDETWNRRFPSYLNFEGYLLDYGDNGFNMYDVPPPLSKPEYND